MQVAFFNPTTREEFDVTVNGWADALLSIINSSVPQAAEKAELVET